MDKSCILFVIPCVHDNDQKLINARIKFASHTQLVHMFTLTNHSLLLSLVISCFFIAVERSIPNPPTDLQILDDIDTRVGFFGHAILNISWQRPLSTCIYNTVSPLATTVSSLLLYTPDSVFLENFTVSISPTMDDTATVCGSDSLNITVSSVSRMYSMNMQRST